jgi:hypothetical protein
VLSSSSLVLLPRRAYPRKLLELATLAWIVGEGLDGRASGEPEGDVDGCGGGDT